MQSQPATKVSQDLLDMMNDAIGRELQVSIQYLWQHVKWSGPQGYALNAEIKKIGIAEMKHAEAIAERLFYLGGDMVTKPNPITVGENLKEMLKIDAQNELDAINLYKQIVERARTEGDVTTRKLFEDILVEEEDHHDFFTSALEQM